MKRCIKKRTNKDVPRGEEGEKEGGGGGKRSLCGGLDQEY